MTKFYVDPKGSAVKPVADGTVNLLVNTVNCVGAMGAGVALAFKETYPQIFGPYREECRRGIYKPGVTRLHTISDDVVIANMPTKQDWRNDSKYEWVAGGMMTLMARARDLAIERGKPVTIRMPMPGCGNGGLDPLIVSRMIAAYMPSDDMVRVVICPRDIPVEIGKRQDSRPIVAIIGSRETTDAAMDKIRAATEIMIRRGWLGRSGMAKGADTAAYEGYLAAVAEGDGRGGFEGYFPKWRREVPKGAIFHELDTWGYAVGASYYTDPERIHLKKDGTRLYGMGRDQTEQDRKREAVARLICRNTFQMMGTDGVNATDAVLCYTPNGSGSGGTGQAIRIAKATGIPVLDLGSSKYDSKSPEEIVDILFAMIKHREKALRSAILPIAELPPVQLVKAPEPISPDPSEVQPEKEKRAAIGAKKKDAVKDAEESELSAEISGEIDFGVALPTSSRGPLVSAMDRVRLSEAFGNEETRSEALRDMMELSGEKTYGSLARLLNAPVSLVSRALASLPPMPAAEKSPEP